LGRTSLEVTSMGLGGAPLGNLFAELADTEAHDTVTRAWQEGIRLFDTAPLYGHGDSERRMGEGLREYDRDGFVLSTKVGRLLEPSAPEAVDGGHFVKTLPFQPVYDYSYDGVLRSFEESLQRLATPRIDILFAHDLDAWTHGDEAARDARVRDFMAGGYKALLQLRDQGAVKAIGAGLNDWPSCEFLARQADFDCFLLAGRYTLLEQDALATFLPLCEERGIGIIVGGPYNTDIGDRSRRGGHLRLCAGAAKDHEKGSRDRGRVRAPRRRPRERGPAISAGPSGGGRGHPRRANTCGSGHQRRDLWARDPCRPVGRFESRGPVAAGRANALTRTRR